MSKTANILINTSHFDGRNSYIYKFPTSVSFKNAKVSVGSVSIYNSTYNISPEFENNVLSLIWLGTTFNITIPSGYYSFDSLNLYIRQQCLINNLYLIMSNGDFVYFIQVSPNKVTYKVEIDLFTIPTSAQATTLGYTQPVGASWSYPVSATTPQIQLNDGLKKLFGFKTQILFPLTPQTTNQTFICDGNPLLSPVFCYVFACNLINTPLSQMPTIMHQMPITAEFGGLITSQQPSEFIDIADQSTSEIRITMLDQNLNSLRMNDPELSLVLNIKY